MTDADQLAAAAREELAEYERFCGGPINPLLDTVQVRLRAAIAAYDAGRAVREAEQEFLEAALDHERCFTEPYRIGTEAERDHYRRVDRYREAYARLLAARKAKEAAP